MSDAVTEFAPAKVNLTLAVGSARADGYHPLDSLVVFADWGDELTVRPAKGLGLELSGSAAQALEQEPQNLALKAAYALRAAAGKPELGAQIALDKHLPVAAGLGGGSADAAAVLRALNQLWDLDFSTRQLAEIGAVIGADVPACIYSRPLRMRSIGEQIEPLIAWPELYGVIVNPGQALSTAAVFDAYDGAHPEPLIKTASSVAGSYDQALSHLLEGDNDLQPSAVRLCPAVGGVLEALNRHETIALARMSGSGASCFGICADIADAEATARALSADRQSWTVQAVRFAGAV